MTSPSPGWHRKQRVWRHNSYMGHATMMLAHTHSIIESDTATADAKNIALQIRALAYQLREALRTRKDPA